MYRHGHLGITLLFLAPISYALIQTGQFALAGLLAFGILIIERLPIMIIGYPAFRTVA
jgi:inner membrane protein